MLTFRVKYISDADPMQHKCVYAEYMLSSEVVDAVAFGPLLFYPSRIEAHFFPGSPLIKNKGRVLTTLLSVTKWWSTKCGDYQYKSSAGREIDPGLEAGRRSRALPGSSSGSSPYPHNYCCLQHTVAPLTGQEGPLFSGVVFFLEFPDHHRKHLLAPISKTLKAEVTKIFFTVQLNQYAPH